MFESELKTEVSMTSLNAYICIARQKNIVERMTNKPDAGILSLNTEQSAATSAFDPSLAVGLEYAAMSSRNQKLFDDFVTNRKKVTI